MPVSIKKNNAISNFQEEYPCRTIPILTSSDYGHRPPIDCFPRHPKNHIISEFWRNTGTAYCIHPNANAYVYNTVNYVPTKPFQWNAQYGYTYAPPRNN